MHVTLKSLLISGSLCSEEFAFNDDSEHWGINWRIN